MNWIDNLKADPRTALIESDSAGIRYLALRDLAALPADNPQLISAKQAAHSEGPIAAILNQMQPAGYWSEPGAGYYPKYFSTVWSIILLAQLGADATLDPRIASSCAYLLEHALASGGQFSASGAPSGTADCLQGNLCWALTELGFEDPRLKAAYTWLARSVTGEGVAPKEQREAAVRYYAGKCGPDFACGSNAGMPCAWGGVKVLMALANCPQAYQDDFIQHAVQRGFDFFLSVDPVEADYPHPYSAKTSGNWWKFGFPVFYVTDLLQLVEALALLGRGNDPALANALRLIRQKQGEDGYWRQEYSYAGKTWCDFGANKQPNAWVTLRALRTLQRCNA